MISRPMLAASLEDPDSLAYPVLTSPKVDGIRCLLLARKGALTRSFKSLPNVYVRDELSRLGCTYLDGELLTLTDGRVDPYNLVQSKLMAHSGRPDFLYLVFDYFESPSTRFELRYQLTAWKANGIDDPRVRLLRHSTARSPTELLALESQALRAGFEGLMVRDPQASYKSGRSTLREASLLKLKRFSDAEGVVVSTLPLYVNTNEQTRDELGLAKRSSHLEGKVAVSRLGSLVLDTPFGRLSVGSGFTQQERIDLFAQKESLIGKIVKFKYLPHGMKDLPRHPIFLGFRPSEDLDPSEAE